MEQNKTREYTLKQRILTLFAIAIGIAFAWGVCGEYMWSGEPDMSSAMLIYGGFWLVYMAGFYFAAWGLNGAYGAMYCLQWRLCWC